MKKTILALISILPFSSISMAASMKLNDLSREEKILLIQEAMLSQEENINIETIKTESDLDMAIEKLIQNGTILDGAKTKKGSGGESVGGFGG